MARMRNIPAVFIATASVGFAVAEAEAEASAEVACVISWGSDHQYRRDISG